MSAQWFWNMAGTEVGPLTVQQLRAMAAAGKLTATDLVKRGRDGAWIKAGEVTSLFSKVGPWSDSSGGAQQQSAPHPASGQQAVQQAVRQQSPGTAAVGHHTSAAAAGPDSSEAMAPRQESLGTAAAGTAGSGAMPKGKPAAAAPVGKKRPPLRAVPLEDEPIGVNQPVAPVAVGPQSVPSSVVPAAGVARPIPLSAVRTAPVAVAARTSPGHSSEALGLSEKRKRRERAIFYGSLAAIGVALVVGIVVWSFSGDSSPPPEEPGQPKIAQQPKTQLEENLSDPEVLEKAKAVREPEQRPSVVLDQTDGDRPGAIQWVDASKGQFAARGDVKVRVREVYVGVPTLVTPTGEQHPRGNDYLWIVIEIVNDSKQKLDYPGLRVGMGTAHTVVLTDNLGRPCAPARFRTATTYSVKGQVTTTAPIGPGESIEDVLLYKDPRGADRKDARVKLLRLQLPGGPFGQQGTFNFEIPLSMAREVAAPSGSESQPREDERTSSPSDDLPGQPTSPPPKPESPKPKDKPGIPGVLDAL